MIRLSFASAAAAVALLSLTQRECAPLRVPGPPTIGLERVTPAQLPSFADDADRASLLQAVDRSLDQLQQVPGDRTTEIGSLHITAAQQRHTLEVFKTAVASAPYPMDWNGLLRDRFEFWRAATATPLVVTGYYEPELAASRERTDRYRYPIYRPPDDLVEIDFGLFCEACKGTVGAGRLKERSVVPFATRAEIDAYGGLGGQGAELAWLDDPIEVFFLHVQGSGLLHFDDGSGMRVSFAASNGRPYRSIGKLLVDSGKMPLESVSLQSLKAYLRAHPSEAESLMQSNERYIFFRTVPVGPIGSFSAPLTAGRSVAVDPKSYPLGSLMFLRTQRRDGSAEAAALSRFLCAQDTGAAITGPARLDVFFGTGATAERVAGPLRQTGVAYVLLAK